MTNQPQTPVVVGAASSGQQAGQGEPLRPSTVLEYVAASLTAEDQQVLSRFWKEWIYMRNSRNAHEDEVLLWERQFDANLAAGDQEGIKSGIKAELSQNPSEVTLQEDRNILEQHLGEEGFKIPYKIVPQGKEADAASLDFTRHVLDFFLAKEDAISELVDFRWDRGKTGTGILHVGTWVTRTVNNVPVDGMESGTKFHQKISVNYHVGLKNVNFWDFWIDERARRWKDATRCVWREQLDIQEFRANYSGRPGYRYVDAVQPVKQDFMSPEEYNYGDNSLTGDARKVYLFHYYNRTTGEYWVIANRAWPIYVGWNIYKDSELPFEVAQMYKRNESVWGIGVGGKTQTFLAYMNNIFGAMLDKVFLTSNPPLVVGGGGTVDGEIYSGGSEIHTLNFNGDAQQLYQLKLDSNVSIHQAGLELASGKLIQNTGMNPGAYDKALSGINPFVAGVQEQARKAKIALTQAMYDVAVGKALTKLLWVLTRYGPQLYADTIDKIVDGKALKDVKWLNVQVEDKVVEEKDGVMKFEDAPGRYGYFEFKPDVFKVKSGENKGKYYDMAVRVTTPTTETMLQELKKLDYSNFVTSLRNIQAMFPDQPLPVTPEELYEMGMEAYAIDPTGVFSKSDERKAREENAKLNEAALSLNPDAVAQEAGAIPQGGQGAPAGKPSKPMPLPKGQQAPAPTPDRGGPPAGGKLGDMIAAMEMKSAAREAVGSYSMPSPKMK